MNKTAVRLAAGVIVAAVLAGCGSEGVLAPGPTDLVVSASPTVTAPQATPTAPPPTPTPEPTPAPTPMPKLPEPVYALFERVGLAGEAGGAPVVSKWTSPIRIAVVGATGDGDRKTLNALVSALRAVRGIPDITFVTEGGNIRIGFVPQSEGRKVASDYSDELSLVSARWDGAEPAADIIIANELIDQAGRDAALGQCLLRALGLAVDPESQYPDSILNTGATAGQPSVQDWLILKLLYDPTLAPGMAAQQAMEAVRGIDPDAQPAAVAPALTAEQTIGYFNEVGFYWETKSRDGIVSKWAAPIKLQITGTPMADQKALLDSYLDGLNKIKGFPGFEIVQTGGTFVVAFQTTVEMKKAYPKMTAAESCYIKKTEKAGKIARCTIGVSTQFVDGKIARNQFLRLLMRAVGFMFTSEEYSDSIFNYSAAAQDWSALDWKMVELLYRADVKPGDKRSAVIAMLEKTEST